MNAIHEASTAVLETPNANELILPQGLIGFPDHHRAELLYSPEHLPFVWMRLYGPDTLHFVVIEAGQVVSDYLPEIFGEDAAQLEIADTADALVLNIVTLRGAGARGAVVNLIGPLIVNRRTRVARQRVIANHARYSAQHPLPFKQAPYANARSS